MAEQSEKELVPQAWPGAFGIFNYSQRAVFRNGWLLVTLIAVSIGVSVILGQLIKNDLLVNLIGVVYGALISVFTTRLYLAGVRGKSLKSEDLFSGNLPTLWLKLLFLNFVVGVIAIVSLLCLIVPFFFIYPRFALCSYFLVDKNMEVFEALGASWNATKGNMGKLYGIFGVNILMCLAFITIIGIPIAIYLLFVYSAATVVLYEYLRLHGKKSVPAAASAA